jgi:hypothetical protein
MPITVPSVRAVVTLLPNLDHGRWPNRGHYMPHVVVGDPEQREAKVAGHTITERYLGVWFADAPDEIPPGGTAEITLRLMYWPEEKYEELVPGATFTLREGPKIVGFGRVLHASQPRSADAGNPGAPMQDTGIDGLRGRTESVGAWVPVLDVHGHVRLGISDEGRWVLQTNETLMRLDETEHMAPLLPLLERSLSDVHDCLVQGLAARNLPEALAEEFPAEELVIFGLNAWGKHWPKMALNWAEAKPATDRVTAVLRRLLDEGRTQEVRHAAKRLLARWCRPVR